MTYGDVSLMIDGAWTKGASGRTLAVFNPATGKHRPGRARRQARPGPRARRRAKGLRSWRKISGQRARHDHAQGRRPDARARRDIARC